MASRPCLPVSRRRKNRNGGRQNNNNHHSTAPVDFSDIATMDASEFLSRVVQQSSQLPEILHRNSSDPLSPPSANEQQKHESFVPIEGSAASLSYILSNRTAIVPPPSAKYLPSNNSSWLDRTLANFSQLRTYLDKLRNQQGKIIERKYPVPTMKDRPGWHIFCVGLDEARGNVGGYYDDDGDNDEDDEDTNKDQEENEIKAKEPTDNNQETKEQEQKEESTSVDDPWREGLPEEGMAPTVSLILQMDQIMIRRVISHLSHYVQEGWYPCSAQRSQWLYSLLARLEKPIHRNDAAVLYSLLKALTRARATLPNLLDVDREGLARLNTLIAIVGVYFEQGGGLCF